MSDFATRLRELASGLDATTVEFRSLESDALLARLSGIAADIERIADGIEPRNCLKPLTSAQARVLVFIRQFIAERGIPPTRQEIADGLGFTVTAAHGHVLSLHRCGVVTRIPGEARGIRLNKRTVSP